MGRHSLTQFSSPAEVRNQGMPQARAYQHRGGMHELVKQSVTNAFIHIVAHVAPSQAEHAGSC